jgi:hypothetical protein
MKNQSIPKISASIAIDPVTHSFADDHAPNLNLTLTSYHPDPITIYVDDLSPRRMLDCGAFTIIDLTAGNKVMQSRRTNCRFLPPTKVVVSLNESLFHTLDPNTPLVLSAPFTRSRANTGGKPLAKHDPNYESGFVGKSGACGVDGLEPGRRYGLSLANQSRIKWDSIRWWEYGTKTQVLRPDGDGPSLDARRVKFGRGLHPAIIIDFDSTRTVEFECRE